MCVTLKTFLGMFSLTLYMVGVLLEPPQNSATQKISKPRNGRNGYANRIIPLFESVVPSRKGAAVAATRRPLTVSIAASPSSVVPPSRSHLSNHQARSRSTTSAGKTRFPSSVRPFAPSHMARESGPSGPR